MIEGGVSTRHECCINPDVALIYHYTQLQVQQNGSKIRIQTLVPKSRHAIKQVGNKQPPRNEMARRTLTQNANSSKTSVSLSKYICRDDVKVGRKPSTPIPPKGADPIAIHCANLKRDVDRKEQADTDTSPPHCVFAIKSCTGILDRRNCSCVCWLMPLISWTDSMSSSTALNVSIIPAATSLRFHSPRVTQI